MELKTCQDIAAPIDVAWRRITQFEQFEEGLRRQDVVLHRADPDTDVRVGTLWDAEVPMMGRTLTAKATVVRMEAPHLLRLEGRGTGIDGHAEITLTALDDGHTRADVTAGLKARALGAQVILQPLRVARGRLEEQFAARVERIARRIETEHAEGEG